jgi:hypothetical protein
MNKEESWFKAEAKWSVAFQYGPAVVGLLALLIVAALRWLRITG